MSEAPYNNRLIRWYQATPDRERRRVGLGLLAVVFVVIIARCFLFQPGIIKTELQVNFEKYVDDRERAVRGGHPAELVLPRIHLMIGGAETRSLLIEPIQGDEGDPRIMRLLTLAREARVFGLKRLRGSTEEMISLRVEDGEHDFIANFSRADVRNNIQAEMLLKLLTIYGKTVQ